MTNLDTLMFVESGQIPEGVKVFRERAAGEACRPLLRVLGVVLAAAALWGAVQSQGSPAVIGVVAMASAICALLSIPSREARCLPRSIVVITQHGVIMRVGHRVSDLAFADMDRIQIGRALGQTIVSIKARDGNRHSVLPGSLLGGARLYGSLCGARAESLRAAAGQGRHTS